MIDYLCIIQARLNSTRLPGKVMMTIGGIPMVKRVWLAAKASRANKVVVAWPERYPELDESNVLARFRKISHENPSQYIIRLTADCPLLTTADINDAMKFFNCIYYNNHKDGHDVQIFRTSYLWNPLVTSREHVINDKPNVGGLSINTKQDLELVRTLCATK